MSSFNNTDPSYFNPTIVRLVNSEQSISPDESWTTRAEIVQEEHLRLEAALREDRDFWGAPPPTPAPAPAVKFLDPNPNAGQFVDPLYYASFAAEVDDVFANPINYECFDDWSMDYQPQPEPEPQYQPGSRPQPGWEAMQSPTPSDLESSSSEEEYRPQTPMSPTPDRQMRLRLYLYGQICMLNRDYGTDDLVAEYMEREGCMMWEMELQVLMELSQKIGESSEELSRRVKFTDPFADTTSTSTSSSSRQRTFQPFSPAVSPMTTQMQLPGFAFEAGPSGLGLELGLGLQDVIAAEKERECLALDLRKRDLMRLAVEDKYVRNMMATYCQRQGMAFRRMESDQIEVFEGAVKMLLEGVDA